MAKKVAVSDKEAIESGKGIKAKKKRGKCCTCCLIALIIVLVILIAAFITGWILGDRFTKEQFGMSLGDTLGVVNDLYWTDDSDVVKRPFSKKDLNGFYNEIKRNVLLKDTAEVDFDGALKKAIDKYLSDEAAAHALKSKAQGEGENTEAGKDEGSELTDIFVDMIVGVLNRENIDIERLNKYNADDPSTDEYIFNLNDKQLAAFIDSVLKILLKNAKKIDSLSSMTELVDPAKVIALKQVRFKASSRVAEDGTPRIKAASADITVWLGLQSAANQAIKKFMTEAGVSWAGGLVGWLGNVILPENLYLTVNIPLYGDGKSQIVINDMNASERARAEKLINGVLKMTGSDTTLDSLMNDLTDTIKPMLEKATDKMDFSSAAKGTISLDLLDTVAKMASEDMEGELTKADFIYVLQALLSDKTAQLESLTPYRYDNWYKVDNKEVYMATGGNPENKIDYEKKFIEEIESKYAVDFGDNATLTDVLNMLGVSLDGENQSAGSTDLLNMMDSARFNVLLNEPDINNLTLKVTDRMLGAALSGQMDTLLKGNEGMENLNATLVSLTFMKKTDKPDHLYAMLAVDVDLSDMLESMLGEGDSLIAEMVTGLMPEDLLLTVTVDITRDMSVARDEAEFVINSCQNTDRVLATLEKFAPDLKLSDVSDKISGMLNDMLDSMDDKLDIELQAATVTFDKEIGEYIGEQGAFVMPDIFTVVAKTVLVTTDADGNKQAVVKPDQLQHVVRDLNNPATFAAQPEADYGDFIDDVLDKYYIQEPAQPIKDFAKLTEYMSDFDVGKLRVYGANGLAYDGRDIDVLHPIMTADALRALLVEKMGGNETVDAYNIVNVATGDKSLSVTLSIKLDDLLADAKQVNSLINASELFATATFHTDQIIDGGYYTELNINVKKNDENDVMDGDTYGAMLAIIKLFASDFDIEEQVSEFGKILYEQMQSLNSSIGGNAEHTLFGFTERGMELTDFYSFLALKMKPELLEKYEPEDIKSTLQGLYTVSENPDEYNANNFKVNEIMFNPPSPETDPHRTNGSTAWDNDEAEALYGNTHLDIDFNGFLKRGVESLAQDAGAITVEQTMILASGDTRKKVEDVRKWLNDNLKLDEADEVDENYDYLVVTFSMGMGVFDGNGEDHESAALFPSKVYATVVYKYDATAETKFAVVGGVGEGTDAPVLIFNNMDSKQYDIVVSLMGVNPDANDENKTNIKSIVKRGAEVLNGMTHVQVGPISVDTDISFSCATDTEGGMGKITISNPTIMGS